MRSGEAHNRSKGDKSIYLIWGLRCCHDFFFTCLMIIRSSSLGSWNISQST